MTDTWNTIDRYVVISSDSHAGADLRDYRPYLAQKWHSEFDAWADAYGSPFDDLVHHTAHRNWDHEFRMSELDADGIAGEVLIPNTIPPFFPTSALIVIGLPRTAEEFERRWAGIQAHNRWALDFASLAPKRRRPLLQIFPNDVDVAVAEIRWAVEQGQFAGALLATVPPGHVVPPFNHLRYDPLWSVCEDLNFPIATHNVPIPDMPMDQPGAKALTLMSGGLWSSYTLQQLILGGVFERHPQLKWVPTESGIDWPLMTARNIDRMLPSMRSDAPNRTMGMFGDETTNSLSLTAEGYVLRHFWYGASGAVGPDVLARRHDVGVDRVMWGTDYPHEEGSTPESKLAIRWGFNDVPEEETRLMLAGNAAELYGFDLNALTPIAKEIGPSVAETHRPITADEAVFPDDIDPDEWPKRPYRGGALLMRSRESSSTF